MMILDRYLLTQYAKHLILVLASLVAIYLLVNFFERIDNFLEAGKSAGLLTRFLLLKIPLMCEQLLPVGLLLAGIITLGLLNHNHELLALKAAGIPITRVVRPLIGGAVLITLLFLASSQWLLPPTAAATNRIWFEEVKQEIPRGIERNGKTFFRGEGGIYAFSMPDPHQNSFRAFSYTAWDENFVAVLVLFAQQADFGVDGWSFTDGQIKRRNPTGDYEIENFDHLTMPLPEEPATFFRPEYREGELSIAQLYQNAMARQGRVGREAWLTFHQRLSYLFLGIPLLILGLPVLLLAHQKLGHDLTLAIPISSGLAFAAWGWWSASQAMAAGSQASPALIAWSMHILAIVLGSFLIRQQNR